jgi:hypothetical protein
MGVEPYRYYTVSPGEVSPAYGIFHCAFKKGQKATGVFLLNYYVKLITGWIFRSRYPCAFPLKR